MEETIQKCVINVAVRVEDTYVHRNQRIYVAVRVEDTYVHRNQRISSNV